MEILVGHRCQSDDADALSIYCPKRYDDISQGYMVQLSIVILRIKEEKLGIIARDS